MAGRRRLHSLTLPASSRPRDSFHRLLFALAPFLSCISTASADAHLQLSARLQRSSCGMLWGWRWRRRRGRGDRRERNDYLCAGCNKYPLRSRSVHLRSSIAIRLASYGTEANTPRRPGTPRTSFLAVLLFFAMLASLASALQSLLDSFQRALSHTASAPALYRACSPAILPCACACTMSRCAHIRLPHHLLSSPYTRPLGVSSYSSCTVSPLVVVAVSHTNVILLFCR